MRGQRNWISASVITAIARGPQDLWIQATGRTYAKGNVLSLQKPSKTKGNELHHDCLLRGVKCKQELWCAPEGARSRTGQRATVKIFLTDSKINEKTPGHHRALSWGSTHGKYYLNLQMNNADYKLGHPCLTCCYMSWRWHSFMQRDEINIKQTPRPVYCCCARLDNVENMATKKKCFAISPQAVYKATQLYHKNPAPKHGPWENHAKQQSTMCIYIFLISTSRQRWMIRSVVSRCIAPIVIQTKKWKKKLRMS